MERFRAELRSRRRQKGESIQTVYQDVRRLLALGYPGKTGELLEIVGRDAFLDALSDHNLRTRVLDQRPETLDAALAIVCQMEAYSALPSGNAVTTDDDTDSAGRRRVRWANSSSVSATAKEAEQAGQNRRIQQLEADLAEQRRQVQQLRADLTSLTRKQTQPSLITVQQPPTVFHSPPAVTQPGWHDYYQQQPAAVTQQPTEMTSSPVQPTRSNNNSNNNVQSNCRGVSSNCVYSETYLDLCVDGKHKAEALVDTGCDVSLIPSRMVSNATLSPSNIELFAVDGSRISVIGCTRLHFTILGMPLFADVCVSPDVDEFMLG